MQTKKNIVITGANMGIGLETAKALYADGHNIIFGSRNEERNKQALNIILESAPSSTGSVRYFKLDLSQRTSIEQFSNQVKEKFNVIDILINNAGVVMNQRIINEMGIEMTMAVNYFGHFYLTYLLFQNIKMSKEARIINLSAWLHLNTKLSTSQDLSCECRYSQGNQYKRSVLAKVQFTVGLAQRLSLYPHIKTMSLHPGLACSQSNIQMCSRTSLYLCRIQFQQLQNGQYYHSNTKVMNMNPLGRDMEAVNKLWSVSENVYGIEFKL